MVLLDKVVSCMEYMVGIGIWNVCIEIEVGLLGSVFLWNGIWLLGGNVV